jgi:hypothetical protein
VDACDNHAFTTITEDVDMFAIVLSMGTSVAIIEPYHGKRAAPATTARELGGKPVLLERCCAKEAGTDRE